MATATLERPVSARNRHPWGSEDHPLLDADGFRAYRASGLDNLDSIEAEWNEIMERAGIRPDRWTLTPLAVELDPLAFAPEIESRAESIRSGWTENERLNRGHHHLRAYNPPEDKPEPVKRDLRARHLLPIAVQLVRRIPHSQIAKQLGVSRALVSDRAKALQERTGASVEQLAREFEQVGLRDKAQIAAMLSERLAANKIGGAS